MSDMDKSIEERIDELAQQIIEFKQELVDEEVEKHLKKFVEDGIAEKNEKGEYYSTVY